MFLAGLYRAERSIVSRLKALTIGRFPWPEIDANKAIPWVEEKTGLTLAESQRDAVRTALASKIMGITGGPGVGETTLVNSILAFSPPKESICFYAFRPAGQPGV